MVSIPTLIGIERNKKNIFLFILQEVNKLMFHNALRRCSEGLASGINPPGQTRAQLNPNQTLFQPSVAATSGYVLTI